MRVEIKLTIDVGDTPEAAADSYMIYQYGEAQVNTPLLDKIENVVIDILDADIVGVDDWLVVGAFITEAADV